MGWSNYIIIPKLKLIVEISRNINESYDYQKKALDYLTDEERLYDTTEEREIGNISTKDISIKDLTVLYSIYEQATLLSEMEPDRFFLYWLESKGLQYEIKSEFDIDDKMKEYKKTYTILRIFEFEEKE